MKKFGSTRPGESRKRCSNCGLPHGDTDKCPATDKSCIKCGKVGHLRAVYPAKLREVKVTEEKKEEIVAEILMDRKIRRELPLYTDTKLVYDKEELRAKYEREKLLGKWREDQRRHAKDTRIKPGELVVVLNTNRAKDALRLWLWRSIKVI